MGGEALEYGEDLARRVLDATEGRGVDVVLDSVGRATQDVGLAVLARFGLLLFYGDASGPPLPIDPDRLYERSLKVGSYTLDVNYRPEIWQAARQELLRWVEEGSLRLIISAILPLATRPNRIGGWSLGSRSGRSCSTRTRKNRLEHVRIPANALEFIWTRRNGNERVRLALNTSECRRTRSGRFERAAIHSDGFQANRMRSKSFG